MEGPLDVPEEPTKDDDYDDDIAEQSKDRDGEAKRSALSFFTAASIARWMAKAYGYAARKKAMYDSQDRRRSSSTMDQILLPTMLASVSHCNDETSSVASVRMASISLALADKMAKSTGSTHRRPWTSETRHDGRDGFGHVLSGEEEKDRVVVCSWVAKSYGEQDKEYHRAYSREIIRQSRMMLQTKLVLPAWP